MQSVFISKELLKLCLREGHSPCVCLRGGLGARGFKTRLPSDDKGEQGDVDSRRVSGCAVSAGGDDAG